MHDDSAAREVDRLRDEVAALRAERDALRETLESVRAFAQSGWNDGTYAYCLICDEALCLTPGKLRGTRAATFAEITHDPECPYPDVVATLESLSTEGVPTPDANKNANHGVVPTGEA